MTRSIAWCCISLAIGVIHASVVDTTDSTTISQFQAGAAVANFENITGRIPQTITSYTSGALVSPLSFIFDQIPGVQFSVGGAVGTNEPALYSLSGAIAGDAHSPTTVLGPVDFDTTTKFNSSAMIEIFFPTKVSRVGFWLNPSLGNVELIAADTNFSFSHLTETTLETASSVTAGHFVGIERPTADIGGFKIIALGSTGFTVDDFSFAAGGAPPNTVPEPGTLMLLSGAALAFLVLRRVRHSPNH